MGHGIAQVAAASGFQVLLNDLDLEALRRGVAAIERNLSKGIQLGKLTEEDRDRTLQHIRGTTNLTDCASANLMGNLPGQFAAWVEAGSAAVGGCLLSGLTLASAKSSKKARARQLSES